jgi:hypothetical protein
MNELQRQDTGHTGAVVLFNPEIMFISSLNSHVPSLTSGESVELALVEGILENAVQRCFKGNTNLELAIVARSLKAKGYIAWLGYFDDACLNFIPRKSIILKPSSYERFR